MRKTTYCIIILMLIFCVLFMSSCSDFQNNTTDLKHCKKYFDGCNTCDVVNGEITTCTEKACLEYEEPNCLQHHIP